MKLKVGLRGGLISLHVQAPCIIVACACLHVRVDLVKGLDGATTLDQPAAGVTVFLLGSTVVKIYYIQEAGWKPSVSADPNG